MLPYVSPRAPCAFGLCSDESQAVMNHEAHPHLVGAYKDLIIPDFNQHVYTDKEDYGALRWVIEKGTDLRGSAWRGRARRNLVCFWLG
jgi:hypothetical protein